MTEQRRANGESSGDPLERRERLYEQARALPEGERSAFLARQCGADAELRAELESLLSHAAEAEEFMEVLGRVADGPADASDVVDRLNAALEGRYTVVRELGRGGMATVYLGRDIRHERQVAIKVLRPEVAEALGFERFAREIKLAAALQHPHILPLHDSGEADGLLFYVMPYVEGESLRGRLAREGELPVPDAIRILHDVAEALVAAHEHGVVHRDVKPGNVLLSGSHALLSDLGVAKAVKAASRGDLTASGVAVGTPAYMSPEQATSDPVDHRADIYGFGAMAYELLAGQQPFTGATAQAVITAHLTEQPPALSSKRSTVPPELETLIGKCLAKRPADRWQSAGDLVSELERIAKLPHIAPVTATGARAGSAGSPAWVKVGLPVGIAVLLAAVWLTTRGPAGPGGDGSTGVTLAAGELRRLAVVPFENLTDDLDDNVWGQLAADEAGRAIDRVGPIAVLPAASVRDAIRTLGADAPVTAVAERLRASHVLTGTFARTGSQVRFHLEFLDVRTGDRLRAPDPLVGLADSLDTVVSRLADVAAGAALQLFAPNASPRVPPRTLPPSPTAYRLFQRQIELICQSDFDQVIAVGNRALEEAPGYLSPLFLNRNAYASAGRNAEADSVSSLLEARRDEMTHWEQLNQDYMTAFRNGDARAASRIADERYAIAPTVAGYDAGLEAISRRDFDAAIERLLALKLDGPCAQDARWPARALAAAYHLAGRYADELNVAHQGLERFPGDLELLAAEARAFAATNRPEAVDSILDVMDTAPAQTGLYPINETVTAALELRAHGYPDAARATLDRALETLATLPPDSSRYHRAITFYMAGRYADADTLVAALIRDDEPLPRTATIARRQDVDYRGLRGVTFARLGRRDDALEVDRWLAAVPEGPGVWGSNRVWRARIHALLGDRDDAVRLLREAFDRRAYSDFHLNPDFDGMRGYPPWEALLAPR